MRIDIFFNDFKLAILIVAIQLGTDLYFPMPMATCKSSVEVSTETICNWNRRLEMRRHLCKLKRAEKWSTSFQDSNWTNDLNRDRRTQTGNGELEKQISLFCFVLLVSCWSFANEERLYRDWLPFSTLCLRNQWFN